MCGWRRWMWVGIYLPTTLSPTIFPVDIELQLGTVVSRGIQAPLVLFPCTATEWVAVWSALPAMLA